MCFRTSMLSRSYQSESNQRSSWQGMWAFHQQQCIVCLLLILGVLTELSGVSTAVSDLPRVQQQTRVNNISTSSIMYPYIGGPSLLPEQSPSSRTIPYSSSSPTSSAVGPWPWAPAPIRHWWAQHHHKRSATSSPQFQTKESQSHHQQKCLRYLQYVPEESVLRVRNGADWARDVCNIKDLNKRVKKMLSASPCDQHRVCQVLSPHELQQIASDNVTCTRALDQWWKKFHNISKALVEFDEVFTTSLDIDNYSVTHKVEECKAAYSFWVCSTYLPLYLTSTQSDDSGNFGEEGVDDVGGKGDKRKRNGNNRRHPIKVEACGSVCREVERRCPFFILGTEEDKAAGNPSFICKDNEIPPLIHEEPGVSKSSQCCYKAVMEPSQGSWLSINSSHIESSPFCVEPDSMNLGWPQDSPHSYYTSSTSYSSSISPYQVSTYMSLPLHQEQQRDSISSSGYKGRGLYHLSFSQRCDILPTPSAALNITSIFLDEFQAWKQSESNASIFDSAAAKIDFDTLYEDEDYLLFNTLSRWFGNFASALTGGDRNSISYSTASALKPSWVLLTISVSISTSIWLHRHLDHGQPNADSPKILTEPVVTYLTYFILDSTSRKIRNQSPKCTMLLTSLLIFSLDTRKTLNAFLHYFTTITSSDLHVLSARHRDKIRCTALLRSWFEPLQVNFSRIAIPLIPSWLLLCMLLLLLLAWLVSRRAIENQVGNQVKKGGNVTISSSHAGHEGHFCSGKPSPGKNSLLRRCSDRNKRTFKRKKTRTRNLTDNRAYTTTTLPRLKPKNSI